MTMTDAELDREWKPSGRRPQSTIARSFSLELMDIFRIENSVSDLDAQVQNKKQTVDRNAEELAALEARIREMETRLRRSQQPQSPLPQVQQQQQQQRQSDAPPAAKEDDTTTITSNKARSSRPGTARANQQAPSSGNMPPTPGASEGEYYIVTRADWHDDGPR
ncbi:hypothetical protein G7046_g1748 [Stylonectria norvegica]|nr:hypothetical protein G7046_g1748 [Stylonectria norvegica]